MRISPVSSGLLALLLTTGASQAAIPAATTIPTHAAPAVQVVPEGFISAETPAEELDSAAAWTAPDGHTWVIVTAKSSHRLDVYDGDSGERLREVGGEGDAPGRFNRPNGIAVAGDRLFVVERDNHRVQVLSLPDFKPIGSFGEKQLRSPYGLWINDTEPGAGPRPGQRNFTDAELDTMLELEGGNLYRAAALVFEALMSAWSALAERVGLGPQTYESTQARRYKDLALHYREQYGHGRAGGAEDGQFVSWAAAFATWYPS